MAQMNCEQVKDSLFESFGGEHLSEDLQNHLQSCDECRKLYEALKAEAVDFGSDAEFQVSNLDEQKLLEDINQQIDDAEIAKVDKVSPGWRAYVPMAAAIILVVGFGLLTRMFNLFGNGDETASVNGLEGIEFVSISEEELADIQSLEVDEFVDQYKSQFDIDDEMNMLDDLSEEEYQYLDENLDIGDIL